MTARPCLHCRQPKPAADYARQPKTRGGYRWSPTRRLLRGQEQQAAKLTDGLVSYIRAVHVPYDRELGARALARRFDVSKALILGVVAGRRWKHVAAATRRAWE